MEDVEVAFLIAISIIAVLITSIWWATRTKKRQAENVKPVKIPLPQEDLRAARNRFYQQKEIHKQPSDHQITKAEPTEPTEPIKTSKNRDRMYSFATLKNSWVSKEQGINTPPITINNTPNITYKSAYHTTTDIAEETVVPQKHDIQNQDDTAQDDMQDQDVTHDQDDTQGQDDQETKPVEQPVVQDMKEPLQQSIDTKVESQRLTNARKSSLMIQPIKQKVLHYKYGSLPCAKPSVIGYDELGHPIIQPIKSFYKLLSWLPGFDNFNVPCVPLRHRGNTKPDVKILVCHDMMGGYVLDKYPQGVSVMEDYHFYHWHLIEGFIYFSHNFITIPPATWTNAAHSNGVLSMGTIITEWEDGTQTCNHLLSSVDNVEKFVDQCVSLANYYQFDGWLVNIENSLQVSVINGTKIIIVLTMYFLYFI